MNNDAALLMELVEAYENKVLDLDKTVLSRLKENFQLYQSLYRSLYDLFLQRGVLKADPYKNERHLSDIYAPEETNMNETELDEQMPIKLSEYDNLLDFLNNYTQFKCQSLNLKKLKILSAIVKFIDWSKLTSTNTHPITFGVSNIAEKLRNGPDAMAVASLQTTHNKLDQVSRQLMKDIKTLVDFKREEYKIFIRQRIMQGNPNFDANPSKDDFVKMVKAQFAKAMEGQPFFPELVQELYDEAVAVDQAVVRKNLIEKLFVEPVKKKVETQAKFNLRDILFEGTRGLGTASRPIDESLAKLRENVETLRNRPRSVFERFQEWIIKLTQGNAAKEIFFEIEIVDVATTMKKVEKLEFNDFANSLQKKSRYLTGMLIKTSPVYAKLEQMKDEEIFEVLERNLMDIKHIMDRLEALDTYFKSETPQAERSKMKGIKVELGNLKNSIALINQKMHEFIARKDELVQLKKLGIEVHE